MMQMSIIVLRTFCKNRLVRRTHQHARRRVLAAGAALPRVCCVCTKTRCDPQTERDTTATERQASGSMVAGCA